MPGQDLDAEGVADLAEVLVAAAEDGELLVVTVQTDRDFRHASPFVGPTRRETPCSALPCSAGSSRPAGMTDAAIMGIILVPFRCNGVLFFS